jgi:hypothetical protein
MELLTHEIRKQIPRLCAQDEDPDPIAYVKFFLKNSTGLGMPPSSMVKIYSLAWLKALKKNWDSSTFEH